MLQCYNWIWHTKNYLVDLQKFWKLGRPPHVGKNSQRISLTKKLSRYTAWAEGEPNNSGDGEDCAVLFDMYQGNQLDRFSPLSFIFVLLSSSTNLKEILQLQWQFFQLPSTFIVFWKIFLPSDLCGSTHPAKQPTCQRLDSTHSTLCARPSFRKTKHCLKKRNKILFTILIGCAWC